MRRIYEYNIGNGAGVRLELPVHFEVVHFEFYEGSFWICVDHELNNRKYNYHFEVIGTDWDILEGRHIATTRVGQRLWHLMAV